MKKKVLLMGKSGSGKTSMRSIIFANYVARDTRRLGPTIDIEHSHVRFLRNLVLNLWDCGGQDVFMESYMSTQKDHMFRNVEVLIYVFDVESREWDRDLYYYGSILDAIKQHSKDAKIFCLLHKMDLVAEEQKEIIFRERSAELSRKSSPLPVTCFKTSIWDETLYKAWSSIVHALVPNVSQIKTSLESLCSHLDASEVILFEKTTFLVISHAQSNQISAQTNATEKEAPNPPHQLDTHRFEKISNIIKQFKLACSKAQSGLDSMHIVKESFMCFLQGFTPNTFIMVVVSQTHKVTPALLALNMEHAKVHFASLESSFMPR